MKGIILGIVVIAAISAISLLIMELFNRPNFSYLMWGSVVAGSCVTSMIEKNKKLLFAILLALPASLIFAIENSIWQFTGKLSDFPGLNGFWLVFLLSIPTTAVLCSIGGFLGWLVTHNKSHQPD